MFLIHGEDRLFRSCLGYLCFCGETGASLRLVASPFEISLLVRFDFRNGLFVEGVWKSLWLLLIYRKVQFVNSGCRLTTLWGQELKFLFHPSLARQMVELWRWQHNPNRIDWSLDRKVVFGGWLVHNPHRRIVAVQVLGLDAISRVNRWFVRPDVPFPWRTVGPLMRLLTSRCRLKRCNLRYCFVMHRTSARIDMDGTAVLCGVGARSCSCMMAWRSSERILPWRFPLRVLAFSRIVILWNWWLLVLVLNKIVCNTLCLFLRNVTLRVSLSISTLLLL